MTWRATRRYPACLQSYEDYLEAVLARADCLRRRGADAAPLLRDTFRHASQLLQSYYPDHVDRTFRWGCVQRCTAGHLCGWRLWRPASGGGEAGGTRVPSARLRREEKRDERDTERER